MDVQIQTLKSFHLKELDDLISVFENVFEMEHFTKPGISHLQILLEKENFIAVVAKVNNKVVAGLTVYVLDQYYATKPLAYIYDLAVLTDFQRKGIGRKLIDFTLQYCSLHGFQEAFVQADKMDDYAIEFYISTKPDKEEQVVHFSYILNNNK